ncbi:MAG: hypothetical protein S4CHLAM6_14900 [Chlamydiae bacterium]|nr:hypothetical protein [Chlamydiota bacterium]
MFELALIKKYLQPRFKQLSVSIISLVSILVITVVVWLVLVFLSVVNGMEKNWTEKLIALSAPLQIMPTDNYYQSDYYQLDAISHEANYCYKTIEEKMISEPSYDPFVDEEPHSQWQPSSGKDLVREVFSSIASLNNKTQYPIQANDFQLSVANARFKLLRSFNDCNLGHAADSQSFLTQIAYLSSFEPSNTRLHKTLLPLSTQDLSNIFSLLGSSAQNIQQDAPDKDAILSASIFRKRLDNFFKHVDISHLKTGTQGYSFPREALAHSGHIKALLVEGNTLIIPQTLTSLNQFKQQCIDQNVQACIVQIHLDKDLVQFEKQTQPLSQFNLKLPGEALVESDLIKASLKHASVPSHIKFLIKTNLQGTPFSKEVFFNKLEIGKAAPVLDFKEFPKEAPLWAYKVKNGKQSTLILPEDYEVGEGVLLPKSFRENGVLCGDRGYLSYNSQTTSSIQEMRIPIFVAGFFDPGLIPNSGRLLLAPKKIISTINAAISVKDSLIGNGINVWFDQTKQADQVKAFLEKDFKARHISPFWEIKTYKEYEYSKDFIEQLSSDKVLFTLIAIIIITVACTNIISMLILLVSDKKKEIGILQAMGASKKSIALIFGGCGLAIGLISSLIGTGLAYLTLRNLNSIINLVNKIQGRQLFNPAFFGDALPSTLNLDAFLFAIGATTILSIVSGLIPAIKAMRLNPTEILKTEQ